MTMEAMMQPTAEPEPSITEEERMIATAQLREARAEIEAALHALGDGDRDPEPEDAYCSASAAMEALSRAYRIL